VVHHAAPELYGHIVATDALGDGYVIPALDTFENIRECMGVAAVLLPTRNDFIATPGKTPGSKSCVSPSVRFESQNSIPRSCNEDMNTSSNSSRATDLDRLSKAPATYIPDPMHEKLRDVELANDCISPIRQVPVGYPKLAVQMNLQPEMAIFRRFGALNAQNLLYLQAELILLEERLREIQVSDHTSAHREKLKYALNWYQLQNSPDHGDSSQLDLVLKIRCLLKEYSQ